jgi:hypothetical protein
VPSLSSGIDAAPYLYRLLAQAQRAELELDLRNTAHETLYLIGGLAAAVGIVPRFRGQFRIEGDQRFGVVVSSAVDFAGFSLWRNSSVPVDPFTFHRA